MMVINESGSGTLAVEDRGFSAHTRYRFKTRLPTDHRMPAIAIDLGYATERKTCGLAVSWEAVWASVVTFRRGRKVLSAFLAARPRYRPATICQNVIGDPPQSSSRLQSVRRHSAGSRWAMKWINPRMVSLLIALPWATGHAASFDCGKAATTNEKAICTDKALSDLDSLLAQTYRTVVAKSRSDKRLAEYLVRGQKAWLSDRDSCSTVTCLRAKYEERIDTLRHDYLPDELFPLPHNSSDWSACVAPPDSDQARCRHEIRCAQNANASYLVAESDICPDTNTNSYETPRLQAVRLYFQPEKNKPGTLVATIKDVTGDAAEPLAITSFEFDRSPDRNGYAVLYIQAASGGTNAFATSQDVYRFDPKDRVPYRYYSGTFDSLRYSNGHLVTELPGRGELHIEIHDVRPLGTRDVVDAQSINIVVDQQPEDDHPTGCAFYDDAGKVIKPPNQKWVDEFCMGAPVASSKQAPSP